MNSYLGQKGYSVLKSEISVEDQIKIRDELNVCAYMPKSIGQQAKFPVYRESPLKMYIPRYYGIKKFGKPSSSKIGEGDNIQLSFNGDLRDYQNVIVNTYMNSINTIISKYGTNLEFKNSSKLKVKSQIKSKKFSIVSFNFSTQCINF